MHVATVQNGTIELSVTPYTGIYDGKAHDAITKINVNPTDAKIEYSIDGENYSETVPTITETSSFTVTVRASKAGYKTQSTTETVKVNKVAGKLTLSATSGTINYPNSTTFTVSENTGTLSVVSSNTNVATVSVSGNTVTVKSGSTAGTAIITVTSAANTNHKAKSATYNITVDNINSLKIGDYVNYKYDTAGKYTLGSKYSGDSREQSISQTTDMKWRILNIDEANGTVDLVSATPTSNTVTFKGILGYNNGPYVMDKICEALYSNNSRGITARSIDLLDMEKHLTADKGIPARNAYKYKSDTAKYGTTKTYTSNTKYPSLYAGQKGAGVNVAEANASTIAQPDTTKGNDPYSESVDTTGPLTDKTYKQADNKVLTVTQTLYSIPINEANYGEAYKVLNNSTPYWVSARYVYTNSNVAVFGMYDADMNLGGYNMFYSNKDGYDYDDRLRPVVSLPSSLLTGEQTNGAWNLSK